MSKTHFAPRYGRSKKRKRKAKMQPQQQVPQTPTAEDINTAQVIDVAKGVANFVDHIRRQRATLAWSEPARQYVYDQLLEAVSLFVAGD